MKYVPHAWAVTVAGILLTIRGMATANLTVNIIGDVIAVIGLIWLYYAWDKLMEHIKAERRRDRKVDKIADAQAQSDMIARAAGRKADEAKAAASKRQHTKGYLRHNGEIIEFERKEA